MQRKSYSINAYFELAHHTLERTRKENVGGSMKEKELEILEQYNIDVKSTRKIRGAILCDTNQGVFLLKEMHFSEKRIPLLYKLYQHLQEQGYKNVDGIVKNKEDSLFSVSEDGEKFILKKWFYGRECDNRKEIDVMEGVRNLALLHRILKKPFEENTFTKEDLGEEFARHNREMKKVRTFIRSKVGKGEFESIFLRNFDAMYEWALCASDRLKNSEYKNLMEKSKEEGAIAHGDYNYHNILMTPAGTATTNFEHFYEGIQITDLYYFLRKTMEKNQWDVELGSKMIEYYNRIQTLSEAELQHIAVCLAYPEKFWKAANSYYRSSKAWISVKSLEKLELAIRQTEEKEKFLEAVFSFRL